VLAGDERAERVPAVGEGEVVERRGRGVARAARGARVVEAGAAADAGGDVIQPAAGLAVLVAAATLKARAAGGEAEEVDVAVVDLDFNAEHLQRVRVEVGRPQEGGWVERDSQEARFRGEHAAAIEQCARSPSRGGKMGFRRGMMAI
jgi:hypothetical protein